MKWRKRSYKHTRQKFPAKQKKKSETTEFLAFSQFINNYIKKKKFSEQVGDALLL